MSVRYIPALLLLQTHIPQSHGYITECPLVNNILFSTFFDWVAELCDNTNRIR